MSSRLGKPHREPSNMRRHPKVNHNAPTKRRRLTMPSIRSQPSLSERIARNKKHAPLNTNSDESETSKNNFNSEDSESEATEELDKARDNPDRTEGLDRRADRGNETRD